MENSVENPLESGEKSVGIFSLETQARGGERDPRDRGRGSCVFSSAEIPLKSPLETSVCRVCLPSVNFEKRAGFWSSRRGGPQTRVAKVSQNTLRRADSDLIRPRYFCVFFSRRKPIQAVIRARYPEALFIEIEPDAGVASQESSLDGVSVSKRYEKISKDIETERSFFTEEFKRHMKRYETRSFAEDFIKNTILKERNGRRWAVERSFPGDSQNKMKVNTGRSVGGPWTRTRIYLSARRRFFFKF